ncbi:hypothetical protein [Aliikangiella sp. IMCC44359]|uniref:hypothetical protein n=1 Tax=Aliikangiella sp. IMCC44359 TaxID=3459125 RepID=UPI00403B18DD
MKNLSKLLATGLFLFSSSFVFSANAPVNIVYPIHGQSYHNYFTGSFSVTCSGGQHTAYWYIDGVQIGQASFYDQVTVQFSQKAPQGSHTFVVKTTCNTGDKIKFNII